MSWNSFIVFAIGAVLFWIAGALVSIFIKKRDSVDRQALPALILTCIGSLVFFAFIIVLWRSLNRPPLRTMGETRLWYSLFLSLVGAAVYAKWRYRWILPFSAVMSTVFVCINIFKPEIHSEALMPALQSVWFVPHVIVYMFAYSLMGAATLFAVFLWWKTSRSKSSRAESASSGAASDVSSVARVETGVTSEDLRICDTLVRIGWGFLTMGIVMGALWAKQAWGDYWAWDPKETWAAATWISYLLYLHLRPHLKDNRYAFALLIFSFILLQMCWWGINYLPAAQGFSVHTY